MAHYSGPDLCRLSACEAVQMLKTKQVSPAELLQASVQRIAEVEPGVNAMPTTCADRATAQIAGLTDQPDDPGWLAGLPIAIKDLTPVRGVRTTWGTKALADFVPEDSDPLVEKLEARGGLIMGKTNTPEMGAGGNTFNDVFGYTRNPWDRRKNAGGSSGGSAVALATGEVWLAQGSDLAGSLRTPAAYCGVVGFRPTPGRAGGGPALIAFEGEGISGPMARNVKDCALFLDAMSGYDPLVPMSLEAPAVSFQAAVQADPGQIRVAYAPTQGGFAEVEPKIDAIMRKALELAQGNGVTLVEACPDLTGLEETYTTLRGILYGALHARMPKDVQIHFKETLKGNIDVGLALSADNIFDAMRQRVVLYHNMRRFLNDHDVLASAVVGLEPGMVEEEYPATVNGVPTGDYVEWLKLSYLATTTCLPAISIPCGFTKSGMPVGIQLIGGPRGEARVLQVAQRLEDIWGFAKGVPIDPK